MIKFNFFYLVLAIFVFGFISEKLLSLDILLMNSLAEQFTQKQINDYFILKNKWEWLSYIAIPILLFVKVTLIAAVLDLGCYISEKNIKYKKLFSIVVKAEFIFLSVIVFKTIWFYFFQTNHTLEDLQYFYPFSLLNIVRFEGLELWFIYPLQVVNLFELAYWIFLAYLLDKELKTLKGKHTGIKIVSGSYGVGLLIWVVGVMFLTFNMS